MLSFFPLWPSVWAAHEGEINCQGWHIKRFSKRKIHWKLFCWTFSQGRNWDLLTQSISYFQYGCLLDSAAVYLFVSVRWAGFPCVCLTLIITLQWNNEKLNHSYQRVLFPYLSALAHCVRWSHFENRGMSKTLTNSLSHSWWNVKKMKTTP